MRASGYERHADDWYVEPAWCVDALIQAERPFVGQVMDPCCGGGNIPNRLRLAGIDCLASDLVCRNDFADQISSFDQAIPEAMADSIVSNPPYNLAQEFVDCALKHTQDRVCVLLRLAFLEGVKRRAWFSQKPLARVWVCSKRVSMLPGGSDIPAKGGAIAYAWFVFEHKHVGPPVIGWIGNEGAN